MGKKKAKDFDVKKVRVGKGHLRKYDSKDAKLLANIGSLKKTIKVATQSITVNKASLNVTSRRLTLAELIGKSRHTSDNVRHHALVGILEFIKNYKEETLLNLYTIVQIASSGLTSGSAAVRKQSRALLLYLVQEHMNNAAGEGSICEEYISLHLTEAVISPNKSIREDGYNTIVAILRLEPQIFFEQSGHLINKLIKCHPEPATVSHVDCLSALFRCLKDTSIVNVSDLLRYLYSAIEYGISASENVTSELGCLRVTSMITKSYKLVLMNCNSVQEDDQRLVECLVCCDLLEYDGLTQRGRETFDALFAEFLITRVEIAIKAIATFGKYHLALIAPLVHLHSVREEIIANHAERISALLISALSLDFTNLHSVSNHLIKERWYQNLYSIIPPEEELFKSLRQFVQGNISKSKQISHRNKGYDATDEATEPMMDGLKIEELILEIFKDIAASMTKRQEVLPILALTSGVSPIICLEEFYSKDSTAYHAKLMEMLPADFSANLQLHLDATHIVEHFLRVPYNKLQSKTLLKVILYMSRNGESHLALPFVNSYLKEDRIREMHEEEDIQLVLQVLFNLKCHKEIVTLVLGIIKCRVSDPLLLSFKVTTDLLKVMVYHLRQLVPQEAEKGIDDHLMPLGMILEFLQTISPEVEQNINDENAEIVELIISQCITMTLEAIIKRDTINVWSVKEGISLIAKRATEPFWRNLAQCQRWNVVLLTASAMTLKGHDSYLQKLDDKETAEDAVSAPARSEWMRELSVPECLSRLHPVVINRLPGANTPKEALGKLFSDIAAML